jgi:hypothetical protein
MKNERRKLENRRRNKSLSLGRGCRDSQQAGAAGEGFHMKIKKILREFLPSPGPSGHPLPAGEGPPFIFLATLK